MGIDITLSSANTETLFIMVQRLLRVVLLYRVGNACLQIEVKDEAENDEDKRTYLHEGLELLLCFQLCV